MGQEYLNYVIIHKYDLCLEKPYTVVSHGKGDKIRSVPLDELAVDALRTYIKTYNAAYNNHLFSIPERNGWLTREGVNYILNKYFERTLLQSSELYSPTISAQCLRHTKAMYLLENGVNLIYIKDLKHAKELDIAKPLDESEIDATLADKFFPSVGQVKSNDRSFSWRHCCCQKCSAD